MDERKERCGFLRIAEVVKLYPVSRATIWNHVNRGIFPKPIKLSENITAWIAEEVYEFLSKKAAR